MHHSFVILAAVGFWLAWIVTQEPVSPGGTLAISHRVITQTQTQTPAPPESTAKQLPPPPRDSSNDSTLNHAENRTNRTKRRRHAQAHDGDAEDVIFGEPLGGGKQGMFSSPASSSLLPFY